MIINTLEKVKLYFQKKAVAYSKVFEKQSPFTRDVLMDLAKFCRAHETTFDKDPRVHALKEGRREVWLRIEEYLNLSPDELVELHKVKEIKGE